MGAPCSVTKEALYLELGLLNIGAIIKARRLNYLHYLVSRNPSEMLYKFFITQWKQGSKDDWTEQVKNDLADVGLPEDLELIKSKSNYSFIMLYINSNVHSAQ